MTIRQQQAAGDKQQAHSRWRVSGREWLAATRPYRLCIVSCWPRVRKLLICCSLLVAGCLFAAPPHQFDGAAAMEYVREVVRFGPRWVGSAGHTRTENWLRAQLGTGVLEEDVFTASTPVGAKVLRNFIAKFPGTKDGIIVVAGHYDTLYDRPDFVGANDGGSSTGLLLQLAKDLRTQLRGGKREGYSVWVVWLDGEEAFRQWTAQDSVYGSRHLAEKWQSTGVLKTIKAFLLVDMVGDAELNIDRDRNSTSWLEDLIYRVATRQGYQSHFFARSIEVDDDHVPFLKRGIPAADLIDFQYGYNNAFWHTKDDTLDKLEPQEPADGGQCD